ncbi:MAG: hypothetical protein KKB59_13945, partial [Spirochaetes bacterium]|nr:hypothetical protein [Spirochaetota bacterium]
ELPGRGEPGLAVLVDSLGRDFAAAPLIVSTAAEAFSRCEATGVAIVGPGLFELEALADPRPGSELAELLVEALGRGLPVCLAAGAARLSGLRGRLAERRDSAYAALRDLGVRIVGAEPAGTAGTAPAGAAPIRAPEAKRKLVDSAYIASVPKGGTVLVDSGTIVTPLALDEAREKGVAITRGARA